MQEVALSFGCAERRSQGLEEVRRDDPDVAPGIEGGRRRLVASMQNVPVLQEPPNGSTDVAPAARTPGSAVVRSRSSS